MIISPHFVELKNEQEIVRLQQVLYENGFCFYQGDTLARMTLEQFEKKIRAATVMMLAKLGSK